MASSFVSDEPDGLSTAGGDAPPPPAAEAVTKAVAPSEPDQQLLRAMADLDNLRKRFQREVVRNALPSDRGSLLDGCP